jgi:hypothetical protein
MSNSNAIIDPQFPAPFRRNGRLFWDRHDIENFKRALIGLAPLERDPTVPITFVTSREVTAQMPFGRRTVGRLVQGRERDLVAAEAQ